MIRSPVVHGLPVVAPILERHDPASMHLNRNRIVAPLSTTIGELRTFATIVAGVRFESRAIVLKRVTRASA